jgi:Fe2+ transport system protein FeoA
VRDELRGCTLDELVEAHPQKRQLDELRLALARTRAELAALEAAKRKGELQGGRGAWQGDFEVDQFDGAAPVSDATAPQLKARIAKQHGRAFMLEQQILSSILRSADVICCTALASASAALRALDFPLVFFDEGSMATEAVSLVPLMKGCAQLAVIGDHRQLPPVVTSAAARREGLALSLFERLLRRADVPSTMLDTQHRMHPRLAAFPNAAFYNGALHDGAPTLAIPAVQSRFLPAEAGGRIAFVTHSARETRADKSLVNLGEAALLARIVVDVLVRNAGLRGRDIGIVVPYAAQVRLLRRMLQERESEEHAALLALFAKEQGGRARAAEAKEIEVHTVDGFEGREKRLILFGSVRNSSSTAADAAGSVGFLADVRRLCVALTRAQAALIVVGHLPTWRAARVGAAGAELLASAGAPEDAQLGCQMLRRFADWAEQCGAVVVCDQETAPALRDDAHELDLFGM